jgi:hypothetical protein
MATTGLGQGNQVFDFSNLGQAGLAFDARQYAKKQEFVKQNASLYDGVNASGIRDVDSPYINQELEKAMELSATAQKTMSPEDAQRAKNAMAAVSQLAATSKAALTQETESYTKLRETPEYIRNSNLYDSHLDQHRQSTAMTAGNSGKVGQGILYQAPVMYDTDKSVAEFASVDAEKILRGALETSGRSVTNADGTSSGWSLSDVDKDIKAELIASTFGSQMDSNKEFKLSVEAQYMADKFFDKTDLTDEDVRNFENAREYGEELRNAGFQSLEDLRESSEFANNPRKLRQAEKAFNIENGIESYGLEMYTNAVDPRATKGKQSQSSKDLSVKGGGNDGKSALDDLALNSGTSLTGVLGNVKIKGSVPNLPNQQVGYASAPSAKAYSSGSGEQRIVTGGVIAQKQGNTVKYFAVEYKPSADIMTKVKELEASGASESAISTLLQQTDATLTEIKGGYSRIPSGDLRLMKTASLREAGLVDISADGNTEEAPAAGGSEGGGVGSKYN